MGNSWSSGTPITSSCSPSPTRPVTTVGHRSASLAFYPRAHTLYRYTWNDFELAWLDQIDVTTGEATVATTCFDAPALAIFFLPKQ